MPPAARLRVGHLATVHHILEAADLAWIGQLGNVMVPVDGGYTMAQSAMVQTLDVLRARLILAMHYFGQTTLPSSLAGRHPRRTRGRGTERLIATASPALLAHCYL